MTSVTDVTAAALAAGKSKTSKNGTGGDENFAFLVAIPTERAQEASASGTETTSAISKSDDLMEGLTDKEYIAKYGLAKYQEVKHIEELKKKIRAQLLSEMGMSEDDLLASELRKELERKIQQEVQKRLEEQLQKEQMKAEGTDKPKQGTGLVDMTSLFMVR